MILVAVRDAPRRETIRAALAHEGWLVSVVGSLDSAFRMAADHAPRLVVLDSALPGSDDLVDVFARANGGPGILLLGEPTEGLRRQADAVVASDVAQGDLVGAVKRCLDAPRPEGRKQSQGGSRRWTSEELFGEILEDLDAAVAAVESRSSGERDAGRARRTTALESATFLADDSEEEEAYELDLDEDDVLVESEDERAATVGRPPSSADLESAEEERAPTPRGGWSPPVDEWPADQEPPESAWPPVSLDAPAAPVPTSEEAASAGEAPESAAAAEAPAVVAPVAEIASVEEGASPPAPAEPDFALPAEPETGSESSGALDALADALLGMDERAVAGPVESVEPAPSADLDAVAPREEEPEILGQEEPPVVQTTPEAALETEPFGSEEEVGEGPPTADAAEIEEIFAAWGVGGEQPLEVPEADGEPEPEPAPAEPRVGEYRLLERIAERRTHELWRAERDDDEAPFAVRLIKADVAAAERIAGDFTAAAGAAAELELPGVAPQVEAGWIDGRLVGVRRWVEGTPLSEVLVGMRELGVRMPLGLALAVGERIAAALASADAPAPEAGRPEGTVHGALHPGNVLLSVEGDVLLTDFGLARALGEEGNEVAAGLLRYRAPEQVGGDEPDRRSDLFSFGALLYELVTGRPAFPGRDAGAVASALLNEAPEEPEKVDPTVPAEVGGLISRLLKRRREERLQGAGEAQRKLDLALQGLPSPPGRRELAAYLRQLRDAVSLVRSVGDEPPEEEAPVPVEGEAAESIPKTVPVGDSDDGDLEAEGSFGSKRLWLAAVVLLLLAVGGALAFWWGRRAEVPVQPTGAPVVVPEPPPRPAAPADGPVGDERRDGSRLEVPPPPPVTTTPAQTPSGADVEALVAEEFDRRQREMEQQLATQQAESADEAADAASDEPPADGPPR